MRAFIKSSGVISPQLTHNITAFPEQLHEVNDNRLACLEPDYRNLINPLLLRRMPRILKMGLAASQLCITRAGNVIPDGIIVGTGLGCLDNLEKFLMDVINNNEHVTSVLPFINSTHNAVAAQISLLLKNHNYNITYCHRGFSFESAIQDAMMLIGEKQAENVLVGGIDECTTDFLLLHSYLNAWKKPLSNLELLSDKNPGTIAGEGSAFFMLSGQMEPLENGVVIEDVHTFFTPEGADLKVITSEISQFLENQNLSVHDLQGVLLGINGDPDHDDCFYALLREYFHNQTALYYKHLCGEYYTSSAFALWLGSVILGESQIPRGITLKTDIAQPIKNLLIYNQINNSEHSLIFLHYGRL